MKARYKVRDKTHYLHAAPELLILVVWLLDAIS